MNTISFLIICFAFFSTSKACAASLFGARYTYPGFLMASHYDTSKWDAPQCITPYGEENCFAMNLYSSNCSNEFNQYMLSWMSKQSQNSGLNFQVGKTNEENAWLSNLQFPLGINSANCTFVVDPASQAALLVFEKTEEEAGKTISALYYSHIDLSSNYSQWSAPQIVIKNSDNFEFGSDFSLSAAHGIAILVFNGTEHQSPLGSGIFMKKLDIENAIWSEKEQIAKGELFLPQVVYDGNHTLITFEEDSVKTTYTKIAIGNAHGFITLAENLAETPFSKDSILPSAPKIALKNGTALLTWVVTDPASHNKRIKSGFIDLYAAEPNLCPLKGSFDAYLSSSDLDSNYIELSCDSQGNAIAVWLALDKNKTQVVQAASFHRSQMSWNPTVDLTEKGKIENCVYKDLAFPTVKTNSHGDTVVAWSWFNGQRNIIQVLQGNINSQISSWNNNADQTLANLKYQSYSPQIAIDEKGSISLAWLCRDIYCPTNLCVTEEKSSSSFWSASSKSVKWNPSSSKSIVGYNIYKDNQLLAKVSGKTHKYIDSQASYSKKIQYAITAVDKLGNESSAQSFLFEDSTK